MTEQTVVAKVEELMKSLDQVKRYKAFTRLMADFLIIFLSSIVALFALELSVNTYKLVSGFSSYFASPNSFVTTYSPTGTSSPIFQLLIALFLFLMPAAGLLIGIFWVDRNLKQVKLNGWKDTLAEGFPGALKLLQELNWDSVLEDVRLSKISYAVYSVIKVIGYWVIALVLLVFPYTIGVSLIHVNVNLYFLLFISLALVLVLSRKDLQRRYRQVVSIDNLTWDLRWFSSEFKSAQFKT